MSIQSTIAAGRRFAETLMDSTCSITRVTDGAWDEDVLDYTDTVATLYEGRCRLVSSAYSTVSEENAEGQVFAAQQVVLHVPVDGTGGVDVNDRVVITASVMDPSLAGRVFRVAGLFSQTYATTRRLPLEFQSGQKAF